MQNAAVNTTYAIEPFNIRAVNEKHLEGIFGQFDQVMNSHIDKLQKTNSNKHELEISLFSHLRDTIDSADYAAIQHKHIYKTAKGEFSGHLKYINPAIYFSSKLATAMSLDLHSTKPMDILDIGTGCGHFPAIANYFGHQTLGIDMPLDPLAATLDTHFYNDLCAVFGVEKKDKAIKPFEEFSFDRKFDLVTALMAAFNLMDDGSPYTIEAWKFFFKNLDEKILNPNGYAVFTLDRHKVTPEVVKFLALKAESYSERNLKFVFRDIKSIYA